MADNVPTSFQISVAKNVLEDLDHRLAQTRWPSSLVGAGWDYGIDMDYLRELVNYWRNDYRWRDREAEMNKLPHRQAVIDGMKIHYVHIRAGHGDNPVPVLLLHGWPGTFLEMVPLGKLLSANAGDDTSSPCYDVIIPSLPGFVFSSAPTHPGFGYMRTAEIFHKLMTETLGYSRYATHGSDVGGFVMSWLALGHPDSVIGIHTLEPGSPQPSYEPPAAPPSDAERKALKEAAEWELYEGAYAHLQRTKPQSLAVGLNDSPAMLAAWLAEKYRTWSDCDGRLESRYGKGDILDIIMLYWVTENAPSSVRAYYERQKADRKMKPLERLPVPTGVALTPKLPGHPPRHWPREYVERCHNISHWVELEKGGHFVSREEPHLIAQSIRMFLRTLA